MDLRCSEVVNLVMFLVAVHFVLLAVGVRALSFDMFNNRSGICSDFSSVSCTEQVLAQRLAGTVVSSNFACVVEHIEVESLGRIDVGDPGNDPLHSLVPYLFQLEHGGIRDSLMMLNITFQTNGWSRLDFELFCHGVEGAFSRRIVTKEIAGEALLNFDCPWMDLLTFRGQCNRMEFVYTTDDGSFSNALLFPRPVLGVPFFFQRANEEQQFAVIPTDSEDRSYLVCIRSELDGSFVDRFEVRTRGSPPCVSISDHCVPFSPKKSLGDGPYSVAVAEIVDGTPKTCGLEASWASLKFTVGRPPVESAAVQVTIIISIAVGIAVIAGAGIFLFLLKKRVVRKVLWLTNVTWTEHLALYNDLIRRVSRLNAFQSRNLVSEYAEKRPANLERELRECSTIVMFMGPRQLFDEDVERWSEVYAKVQCHLGKEEFFNKLVLVQPSYLDGATQFRGRVVVVYDGRNVEDVVEAIAGEPDVIELVKSPFYPSIRCMECVPEFVNAEKRVLDYKKRFDVRQLQAVEQLDDYNNALFFTR